MRRIWLRVSAVLQVMLGAPATSASVHHPAALRNRGPIVHALRTLGVGTQTGPALEIGSGTGAHIEFFADAFPALKWQPSEKILDAAHDDEQLPPADSPGDETLRALHVINAHGSERFPNVLPAVAIDAALPWEDWPAGVRALEGQYRLLYCSNVCHIAPWSVTCGIIAAAGRALAPGSSLCIYGPFKVDGKCTTESNEAFDQSLRARNAEWGIRDIEALTEEARGHHLAFADRCDMPANNFMLHFVRTDD